MEIIVAPVLFFVSVLHSISSEYVITSSGKIRGKIVNYGNTNYYYSYQGIPYAEKPIGQLRFKAPVPITPWDDVLDATKTGHVCVQPNQYYTEEQMSEECLYLNVYVPKTDVNPLAVLVYLHGGEFSMLSGDSDVMYNTELLLRRNIIVVTLNYRLGALGFLSLGTEDAPGNAGIKDVILALKWINENIEQFGGDPSKITLGGNSAGSVLAHYVSLTEQAAGIFHQTLLISGSALGYRFRSRYPREAALTLAKELGIHTDDDAELLESLIQMNASDIISAQVSLGSNDTRKGYRPFAAFLPCIEIEHPGAVITRDPIEIIKSGLPSGNLKILAGFNNKEGIKMLPANRKHPAYTEYLNDNFELCIPSNIEYPYGSKESLSLADSIQEFYLNGEPVSNTTLRGFVDLITDTQFAHSIDYWLKLRKEQDQSNVIYYYVFNFEGQLNWFHISNNETFPGTAHADELGYLFKTKATSPLLDNLDSRTQTALDVIQTLMTNFVKYGNPTPDKSAVGAIWPECGSSRDYFLINDHPQPKSGPPIPENLNFWYNIYDQYYKYKESGGVISPKIMP